MRRADRLFDLLHLFRSGRLLTGQEIARRLGVHVRTVYRDINALTGSGVPIEGERGVGFVLRAPIFLPPLTLTPREVEALQLGVAMVQGSADAELADAAQSLAVKIHAVLPNSAPKADHRWGFAVHPRPLGKHGAVLGCLRRAVRACDKLRISYTRLAGEEATERVIWPLEVEYWGHAWTCTAWCELRAGFRVFRIDRIAACTQTGEQFRPEPGKRLADYLATVGLSAEGVAENGR